MTNEEIIALCAENTKELLWENNQKFIKFMARRFINQGVYGNLSQNQKKDLYDDLIQCGFIAIVDALKTFDAESGLFITHLGFYLKKHFGLWCIYDSGWSIHGYRNAFKNRVSVCSIYSPLGDSADSDTLADTIADERDDIDALISRLDNDGLRVELKKALSYLDKKESIAVQLKYCFCVKNERIADALGVSEVEVKKLIRSGMRRLRAIASKTKLSEYIEQNTNYYRHVSAAAFQNKNTSAVELIAMQKENEFLRQLKCISKD